MSFSDALEDKNNGKWEVLDTLGEVQKNRYEVIKITKATFKGKEFIQMQVWKEEEDGTTYPLKTKNIVFKPELIKEIIKALKSGIQH